jgi:hypothetical protein
MTTSFLQGLKDVKKLRCENFKNHPNCLLHIENRPICQEKIEYGKGVQILFNIDFFSICVNIESIPAIGKKWFERGLDCSDPFWPLNFRKRS